MNHVLDIVDFSIIINYDEVHSITGLSTNNTVLAAINHELLIYLTCDERLAFLIAYILLYGVTIVGNIAAIIATCPRNHRCLQKTCILSLAVSDIISATVIVLYCLDNFIRPYTITWGLGKSLCHLIPTLKTFGSLSSCAAIIIIALDRYHNVAKSRKFDPPIWACILAVLILGAICAGISYPNYKIFRFGWFNVDYSDINSNETDISIAYTCISIQKEQLMIYNVSITVIVFLPLILIFCWLYLKIAIIVWKHRKPLSKKYTTSTSLENSTTQTSLNEISSKSTSTSSNPQVELMFKKKKQQAERKVRTFKIVVVLVFAFITCRLPFCIFDILRSVMSFNEHKHWIMRYVFNAINLLGCALNPLLYTFLNQTITIVKSTFNTVEGFFWKVCCCFCVNADFDDLEESSSGNSGTYIKRANSSRNTSYMKQCKVARIKSGDKRRVQVSENNQNIFLNQKKY